MRPAAKAVTERRPARTGRPEQGHAAQDDPAHQVGSRCGQAHRHPAAKTMAHQQDWLRGAMLVQRGGNAGV